MLYRFIISKFSFTFASELKNLLIILAFSGIFLQPFSRMLGSHFFQTYHYYPSSQKGKDGQQLSFCGTEKAVTKEIQKDADRKDKTNSDQSNLPEFQIITHETIAFKAPVFRSVIVYFDFANHDIPSTLGKTIFQPPRFNA